MSRKRSSDTVTAATTSFLWPFLKQRGFVKPTARVFAREVGGFFQQFWLDANGFGGKTSVRLHYNVMPVAEENIRSYSVGGYVDSWNMSSHELADTAMQDVIELIKLKLLPLMDSWTGYEAYITEFRDHGEGIREYKDEMLEFMARWSKGKFSDEELARIDRNRRQLKLDKQPAQ